MHFVHSVATLTLSIGPLEKHPHGPRDPYKTGNNMMKQGVKMGLS